ncbi:hypothetical protein BDN72DRAFT_958497 [Pluteus cervinus]|uniref:Uncharacterized protein n=1 Tax=Pluteus cervinus TaxID=181527 RepID=A0ACD3AZD3_9AGAR|nr:hypothetical protein BDN72DRAFT_958497 [Pluteus cervinus]
MDSLALELLEDILYHVYEDLDPTELSNTFRNCSLVSHQWKEIAQPLLFSKFLLHGRRYDQVKLHQTLISYPHLRDLVRCIWIDIDILSGVPELDSNAVIDLYRQLTSNPRLYQIVIQETHKEADKQSFKTICGLVSSSHLTILSLWGLRRFPIGLLYQCTSVRELHIYRSTFSGYSKDGDGGLTEVKELEPRSDDNQRGSAGQAPTRPRLARLYLEAAYEDDVTLMKWFMHPDCAFDISELKTFHFLDMSNKLNSYALARSLAQSISSSLEDLALDPPTIFNQESYYKSPEYNRFDPLPQLRRLKLSLQQDDFPDASLLPWTIQFLSALPHPERLEELHIPSILTDYKPEAVDKDDGWEDLDLFLTSFTPPTDDQPTGHRRFSNLNSIQLGVVILYSHPSDDERLRTIGKMLPSLLPRSQELGILKVSFSTVIGFLEDTDCWYHSNSE